VEIRNQVDDHFLTNWKSIPDTFIKPIVHYYTQKQDQHKPVLQERNIKEAKNYCRLGYILISEAHATPRGEALM
jgi:hypothetical protein